MGRAEVYGMTACKSCQKIFKELEDDGYLVTKFDISDLSVRDELESKLGHKVRMMPVIIINNKIISLREFYIKRGWIHV